MRIPCDRPLATIAPACTIGPSLPQTRPAAIEQTSPPSLARSAESRSMRGSLTRCRYVLTSGMPEPPAMGSTNSTRHAAITTKQTEINMSARTAPRKPARRPARPGVLGVLQIFGGDVDSEGEQTCHGAEQHAQHPLQESMQPAVEAAMPAPPILPAVEIIARQGLTRQHAHIPGAAAAEIRGRSRRSACWLCRVHSSATRRTVTRRNTSWCSRTGNLRCPHHHHTTRGDGGPMPAGPIRALKTF